MRRHHLLILSSLLPLLAVGVARAGTPAPKTYTPKKVAAAKVRDVGWDGSLTIGSSVSLSDSRAWTGTADGTSFSLGLTVNAGLDYIKGMHEWRNTFSLSETFTRTPSVDAFIKSNDTLELVSLYLLHFKSLPWLGPFARATLKTSVFESTDVRGEIVDYEITGPGKGENKKLVKNAEELGLTEPFSPLRLSQTLGVYAQPVTKTPIAVEVKLGFSANETVLADGQLAVTGTRDPAAADRARIKKVVEVKRLRNVYQGGPAAGILLKGKIWSNKVVYAAGVEAMLPVLNNDSSGKSLGELLNVSAYADLSFKLVSWASLDYKLRVLREPQLVDQWQVQNSLLLSFSYTLLKSAQK